MIKGILVTDDLGKVTQLRNDLISVIDIDIVCLTLDSSKWLIQVIHTVILVDTNTPNLETEWDSFIRHHSLYNPFAKILKIDMNGDFSVIHRNMDVKKELSIQN